MSQIHKTEVMRLLLQACPSFQKRWDEHCQWWGNDEPLLYVDLGEFADHLVRLYNRGNVTEFRSVFDIVEKLHVDGDDYVREAATVGLLEDIQTSAQNRGLDPEAFVQYLRPESLRWWRKLDEFWKRGKLLTDD